MTSERGVAWWRMFAVSVISTMKVDSPRASMSDAPTRVKMRSVRPMTASDGGDERPGVSHQRDQGTLAEVGRLAAHVGPGQEDDLGGFGIEVGVVGNERRVALQLLQHRVPPLADGDAHFVRHRRPTVAPAPGAVGKGGSARRDARLAEAVAVMRWAWLGELVEEALVQQPGRGRLRALRPTGCVDSSSLSSGVMKRSALVRVWRRS